MYKALFNKPSQVNYQEEVFWDSKDDNFQCSRIHQENVQINQPSNTIIANNEEQKQQIIQESPQVMEYNKLIHDKFLELQQLIPLSKQNNWKQLEQKKSFQSHCTDGSEINLRYNRAEGVITAPLQEAVNIITNPDLRCAIDENIAESKLLEKINDNLYISYFRIKGKLMFSDKDFIVLNGKVEQDQKIYLVACSLESSKYPSNKGITRGQVILQGWCLQKNKDSNQTDAINIIRSDPKQSVPGFVQEKILKMRSEFMLRINEYIEKQKKAKKK